MKVKIAGNTPLERLTNFTRGVIAVSKTEISELNTKSKPKKRRRRKRGT
jgi:hypothetical protein